MNEENLEKIDQAMAEYFLIQLKKEDCAAAIAEAARKYLAFRGYTGVSTAGLRKAGATKDPRLQLPAFMDGLHID